MPQVQDQLNLKEQSVHGISDYLRFLLISLLGSLLVSVLMIPETVSEFVPSVDLYF